MTQRIAILTGGGDSASLNAVIRAVTKHAILGQGWEVIGFEHGFRGLVENRTRPLDMAAVRGILARGGTILGASARSNPFRYPVEMNGRVEPRDLSERALANLTSLGVSALVVVGGDGTMDIAAKLGQRGARVVGVPKTIDNDLPVTDSTCGYPTAVEVATQALDRLHTTAESHDRVMLCEVMGRNAGWIALEAGLAGGAHVILIPEIPYRLERIAAAIEERRRQRITYALVVVAEGARRDGGAPAVARPGDPTRLEKLGGAADRLAGELGSCLGEVDVRVTVLGHIQRGGTPTAGDRILATRCGVAAVDLIAAGNLGRMVVLRGREIGSVPMTEVCRGTKLVDPAGELVRTARSLGVELGG